MPKVKVTLSIGYSNANHEDIIEVDNDDYNDCKTDKERNDLLNDYWHDWSNNYIEGSCDLI